MHILRVPGDELYPYSRKVGSSRSAAQHGMQPTGFASLRSVRQRLMHTVAGTGDHTHGK